jgi:hypothetical protein
VDDAAAESWRSQLYCDRYAPAVGGPGDLHAGMKRSNICPRLSPSLAVVLGGGTGACGALGGAGWLQ